MADFSIAYAITAKVEGGYANNAADHGGETWRGIARNVEKNWKGWSIIDAFKNKPGFPSNLNTSPELQQLVLDCYKTNYWNALNLDLVQDQKVANELYDTAVNMGTGTSSLFFQRVLNVVSRGEDLKLDGSVGPKTVAVFNALNASDRYMVFKLLNCLQGAKYIGICEANPTQKIFIRSWSSRVFE